MLSLDHVTVAYFVLVMFFFCFIFASSAVKLVCCKAYAVKTHRLLTVLPNKDIIVNATSSQTERHNVCTCCSYACMKHYFERKTVESQFLV